MILFLTLLCIFQSVYPYTENCKTGWTPVKVEDGRHICVKAFTKLYFFSFKTAGEICSEQDGFVAAMPDDQYETAIQKAVLAEIPAYAWYKESLQFYLNVTKVEDTPTFKWTYGSKIPSNKISGPHNCLVLNWNYKQPNASLNLKESHCGCTVPGYCAGRNRGVICAKKMPKCNRNPSTSKYAVAFIMDTSFHTMQKTQNQSLSSIISFVKHASSLLLDNDIIFVRSYGGQKTYKDGSIKCYYNLVSPTNITNIDDDLITLQKERDGYYNSKTVDGWGYFDHTVIYCGFAIDRDDSVANFFKNNTDATRVVIHIGSGMNSGIHSNYKHVTTRINELKSADIQMINIAPKWGNTEQMKEWSTDPSKDYFEVDNLDSKSLSMKLAEKILHVDCKCK